MTRLRRIDALGEKRRVMKLGELSEYLGVPLRTLQALVASRSKTGFPAYEDEHGWQAELGEVIDWLVEKHERGEDLTFLSQEAAREAVRKRQRSLH